MSSANQISIDAGTVQPTVFSDPHCSPCQHEVQFYFDDRFLIRSLSELIEEALLAGSSAIVVATPSHRDSLAEELGRAGINVAAMAERGRYLALDADQTLAQFTVEGTLDKSRFEQLIGEIISCSAAAAPSKKVIVFGEMVMLLWQRGQAKTALQLEDFWNDLAKRHSFHLRCAYHLPSFDREVHTELFSRICGAHHAVIPAEGYTSVADENERLRTVARLQQTEQVVKKEAEDRKAAQAQTLEVQSRNQKLLNEVRQREAAEEELRRFTRRLLTARDEEQRRIAAQLHENMAQLLAALSLYFGVLHEEKDSLNPRVASVVDSSRSVSENLLGQIRKLSHLLHPPTLDDMGLRSAVQEYVEQFQNSSGVHVNLEIAPDLGRFDRRLEISVFRIVEEGLSTVYPRGADSFASVRLNRSSGKLIVEIQNSSSATAGGEAAAWAQTRMTGIHARVIDHGGSVRFSSDPAGTLISVTLPLKSA